MRKKPIIDVSLDFHWILGEIDKISLMESGLDPISVSKLTTQKRGWNLEGLTEKRGNRWKLQPPSLNGKAFFAKLVLKETGMTYDLNSFLHPYKLELLEARLLGIVHRMSTTSEKILAKKLNVGRKFIAQMWKKEVETLIERSVFYFDMNQIQHSKTQNIIKKVKKITKSLIGHRELQRTQIAEKLLLKRFSLRNYIYFATGISLVGSK